MINKATPQKYQSSKIQWAQLDWSVKLVAELHIDVKTNVPYQWLDYVVVNRTYAAIIKSNK